MRGIRFNIVDTTLHPDAIHRGGGQIIQTARKCFYASEMAAAPSLQEPIFSCEITAPMDVMGGVYNCLNQRRGTVNEEEQIAGTPMNLVRCYLPVAESFGFTAHLRGLTQGQAFPQCVFSHWNLLSGDVFEPTSKVATLVKEIRIRKGMKEVIPKHTDLVDRL